MHFLFTGLSDITHNGVWYWQHSGEQATYTNWQDGQPDGNDHCAGMKYFDDDETAKWFSISCTHAQYHAAFCEADDV